MDTTPTAGWLDEVAEKIDLTGVTMGLSQQRQSFGRLIGLKSMLAENYILLIQQAISHLEKELKKGDDPLVKLGLTEEIDYFTAILERMSSLDPILLKMIMASSMRLAVNTLVSERLDMLQRRLEKNLDAWLLKHDPEDLKRLWVDLNRHYEEMVESFLRGYPSKTRPESIADVPEEDQGVNAYKAIAQQREDIDLLSVHMGLSGYGGLISPSAA